MLITRLCSCLLQLTYADITFFDFFNGFLPAKGEPAVPEQLSKLQELSPKLAEHYKRVLAVPEIKAWVEKRPKTDY